jgi:aryl-alcohol dehydrogenase-like predicted oxidoreductase
VEELPELALRFCLSDAAVSSVIPGMRSPAHARANAEASQKGALSPEMIKKLRSSRWVRNYYD